MKAGTLGALMRPLTAAAFLDRHWPRVPLVAHGAVDRLGDWAGHAAWSDPSKLLRGKHDGIRAWPRRVSGGVRVTAEVAERHLASRDLTLTVDGVAFPALDRFRKRLARELGTPARATQCNVYLSPKGGGTKAHFDSHEVFFLQLSGRKRWRYAEAVGFPFPPGFAFDGGKFTAVEVDGQGLFAGRASLPGRMKSVVLEPGSVLFLPRGYWHAPTTLEDSVHVTLALNVPTFRHLLLEAIGRRMMSDPRWREPAAPLFLNAGSPAQERARAKLAELLGELGPMTEGLDAADVIDPAPRRRRRRS